MMAGLCTPVARVKVNWLVIRLAVMAVTVFGMASPAGAAPGSSGRVLATYEVNIRACARLDCQVIGSAKLGEDLLITGDPVNGFYPVTWYGREGFAYALYVSRGDDAPWFVEGDPACNQVAIVFNIGIGHEPSGEIIDTLLAEDVPATMFPMGWWAREHPEFLRRLDAEGFVIGTHGDQPLNLTSESDEMVATDVSNSVRTIETILGREIDQYFTPYAADTDPRVRGIVSDMGLLPVGWNISANDFGTDATAADVYARVVDNLYPGAIIEMHLDGPSTANSTADALPGVIEEIRAQGYDIVSVPDLVIPCEGGSVGR